MLQTCFTKKYVVDNTIATDQYFDKPTFNTTEYYDFKRTDYGKDFINSNPYRRFRSYYDNGFNTEIIKDIAGLVDFYRFKEGCDISNYSPFVPPDYSHERPKWATKTWCSLLNGKFEIPHDIYRSFDLYNPKTSVSIFEFLLVI